MGPGGRGLGGAVAAGVLLLLPRVRQRANSEVSDDAMLGAGRCVQDDRFLCSVKQQPDEALVLCLDLCHEPWTPHNRHAQLP